MSPSIPPAKGSDPEDVTWALQTADALWRRNERADALTWLRRAVQAAGEADDPERAFVLADAAAELTQRLEDEANGVTRAAPSVEDLEVEVRVSMPPDAGADVDDLLGGISVSPPPLPSFAPPRDEESIKPPPPSSETLIGAPAPPSIAPPPLRRSAPSFPEPETRPVMGRPDTSHRAPVAPPKPPVRPPPLPPKRPPIDAGGTSRLMIVDGSVLDAMRDEPAPVSLEPDALVSLPPPAPVDPAPVDDNVVTSAPPLEAPPLEAPAEHTIPAPPPAFSLDAPAFADLPDENRDAFARAGTVHHLQQDEEVPATALCYVIDGDIRVASAVADAAGVTLHAQDVMRARGTLEASLPLRLAAASEQATVVTWDNEAVSAAFAACPWVESELRTEANRTLAICGATIGPLGERLDESIFLDAMSRFEVKVLLPGEALVAAGAPLPGLCIVGVGEVDTAGPGDFVFPEGVLSPVPVSHALSAGAEGALVLVTSRTVAQELLVTCPPLLEILAGM